MWTLLAWTVVIVSLAIMLRSGWRWANYMVGFEGFGGNFNPWLIVVSWSWVGLFYLAYNYLF